MSSQCQLQLCTLLSFSMSHHMVFVFLQRGENEHRCCHLRPILFKCCCFPLLAMLLFALPLTAGSPESFLLPALGNHAHSLDLCVTHHGNKCVHSFEDCHDGACLSDFPPHIVRPSNHPPHPTVAMSTSVENGTINGIIVLDVVLLSVLWMWPPKRPLQPPRPPLPQRRCCVASSRL